MFVLSVQDERRTHGRTYSDSEGSDEEDNDETNENFEARGHSSEPKPTKPKHKSLSKTLKMVGPQSFSMQYMYQS